MSSDDEVQFITEKKDNRKLKNNFPDSIKTIQKEIEHDEEVDVEIPSGAECLSRCKEFASITGTDTALAMFYLQDTKWDLENGLNAYYQTTQETGTKVVACFDVEALNNDENRRKSNEKSEMPIKKKQKFNEEVEETKAKCSFDQMVECDENEDTETNKRFKIFSWNIDGLDVKSLESRTVGVANKILEEAPDCVLLQEVVAPTEKILRSLLDKSYEFTSGCSSESSVNENFSLPSLDYYTMILNKKSTSKLVNKSLINFNNSVMGRNLLKVKLSYKKKLDIYVLTTHLESTAEYSKQRIEQLRKCFKEMLDLDQNAIVFFGGDLNLRNTELTGIGGTPKDICDLWEATGSRKECSYTWDLTRNTNLKLDGKFAPRCRFDRLYFRSNNKASDRQLNNAEYTLMPIYFELEGLEKLKTCGRFCSDHWAIVCYCDFLSL